MDETNYRIFENGITKTLIVKVDEAELLKLKQNGYKICIAKKVSNQEYNVVWESYGKYLCNNKISWTPAYEIFGTNTYEASTVVSTDTNKVRIGIGEETTISKEGLFSPAITGSDKTVIKMINKYGDIHPGINQISKGLDGIETSRPFYVAPQVSVNGAVELKPIDKVLVWFEQNIETSTMFSTARSLSKEVDLTSENTATILYVDGDWKIV